MEITYSHGTVSPEEVVKYLSLTGRAASILGEIILAKESVRAAGQFGLRASDEALQEFADDFREQRGLHGADETRRFMDEAGLTGDDLEAYCESCVLASAVREHMARQTKVEEYFASRRSEFDRARISVIRVEAEELAKEILMRVTEDGEDFHQLARRHSCDDATRHSGGYVGVVGRRTLSPEVAAKVFNAGPGDVLGPFRQDDGIRLVLVEEVSRARLDDETRESIEGRVFAEWRSGILKEGMRVSP